MPRKAKEKIEKETKAIIKKAPKIDTKKATKKSSSERKVASKKATTKKADTVANKEKVKKPTSKEVDSKKNVVKKAAVSSKTTEKKSTTKSSTSKKVASQKETTSKSSTEKKTATNELSKKETTKKESTKKEITKKEATKETTTSKVSKTKKASASKTSKAKKTTTRKTATKKSTSSTQLKVSALEYYDLPYRYNQTVVKILAQTPNILFVYWDISDSDRERLTNQYGEHFFENTKPYLLVTNESMHYQFEVEINDYANSWYFHISDSDCTYKLELIRKPINQKIVLENNMAYITSSNVINSPNDHILFERLGKTIFMKDTKTNATTSKDISTMSFMNRIGTIYNIYDLYKEIYQNELNGDELGIKLSSSQFSS